MGNACANWALRKKSHPSVQEREEGKKKAAVGPRLGRTSNLGRCGGEEKWKSFQGPFTGGNGLKDQRRACEQMDLGKPSGPGCDGHRRDAWGTRTAGRCPGEPRHTRAPRPNPGARSAARAPGGGTSVTGAPGGLSGHVQSRACHPAEIALEAQTRFRCPDTH